MIYTPAVPPGDEVEVTATWDVRDRRGDYLITVTADAFSQIVEARTDNNSASVHVAVADARVDIAESRHPRSCRADGVRRHPLAFEAV